MTANCENRSIAQQDATKTSPNSAIELTIFSAPKAFKGHIGLIQRNAIRSWLALGPRVQVILLGQDAGTAEVAAEFGIEHLPDIATNSYGTPLLNSLVSLAQERARAPYLCMINADIILTNDCLKFLDLLPSLPEALYIGLRSDLDVTRPLDFNNPDWQSRLTKRVHEEGRFRGAGDDSFNGTDYYIFPKNLYASVPPFAIGRFFWDSWLIADVLRRGLRVINISNVFLAVHQNHNYGHVQSSTVVDLNRYWLNPELKDNFRLAGGFSDLMGPREAPEALEADGIKPVPGKSLEASRRHNQWYYRPIVLRSSWLFRPRPMATLWNHIFPFHAPTGRHGFRLSGFVRYFAYEWARPVWKLLPTRVRKFGHMLLRDRGRIVSAAKGRLHKSPEREWSPAAAAVHNWLTGHVKEDERTIAPPELAPKIGSSAGYTFLRARANWRFDDLDFFHIVVSRERTAEIPPGALRLIYAKFNEVYRDEQYTVLSRFRHEPRLSSGPWSEVTNAMQRSSLQTGDILAVLNVWKRGPHLLRRQLDSLIAQTAPPKEIWVCALGVSDADAYRTVVESYRAIAEIHFIESSKNFKYHGRFQLALAAETQFVAFIDDDIILGRDFLRRCRAIMDATPDAGEVGIYGWERLPGPDGKGVVTQYHKGRFIEHLPPEREKLGLVEVDLLCGFHFLRTSNIRFLFRDEPWTRSTGEDFQLAFALRKYAGLKSYVIPVDPNDPDSWGLSADWRDIRDHATTVGDMDVIRDTLYWHLLNRGHTANWMKDEQADYALVAVSNTDEAHRAQRAVQDLIAANPDTRVLYVYCGEDRGGTLPGSLLQDDGTGRLRHRLSWIDLELHVEPTNPLTRASDAIHSFAALIDGLPVRFLLLPDGNRLISAPAEIASRDKTIKTLAF